MRLNSEVFLNYHSVYIAKMFLKNTRRDEFVVNTSSI
jgi:hypothetical protein